jgi:hypothetical protein
MHKSLKKKKTFVDVDSRPGRAQTFVVSLHSDNERFRKGKGHISLHTFAFIVDG